MMFYVEQNNEIVLCDTDRAKLSNTLDFMPQYQGLEIQETDKNIVYFNDKYYFEDDEEYLEQAAQKREQEFHKEFFNTSLGYIRRKVTMADGSHKDFLSDLLPVISMAVNMMQPVTILAYNEPDFTQDVEDWTIYQHAETATAQFIQECFNQLQKDFIGQTDADTIMAE